MANRKTAANGEIYRPEKRTVQERNPDSASCSDLSSKMQAISQVIVGFTLDQSAKQGDSARYLISGAVSVGLLPWQKKRSVPPVITFFAK